MTFRKVALRVLFAPILVIALLDFEEWCVVGPLILLAVLLAVWR